MIFASGLELATSVRHAAATRSSFCTSRYSGMSTNRGLRASGILCGGSWEKSPPGKSTRTICMDDSRSRARLSVSIGISWSSFHSRFSAVRSFRPRSVCKAHGAVGDRTSASSRNTLGLVSRFSRAIISFQENTDFPLFGSPITPITLIGGAWESRRSRINSPNSYDWSLLGRLMMIPARRGSYTPSADAGLSIAN